jgi:16S rRNA (cytosine1402-N4)-methyltransferase
MDDHGHIPVLPKQVMELLAPQPGEVAADLTLGRGGHAELIGPALAPGGRLLGFDLDEANLAYAGERLAHLGIAVETWAESFVAAPRRVAESGLTADIVLADLGFSSNQMDDPQRGFSFSSDGPLDMRLDPRSPATAADLVNQMSETELADIIFRLGEEPLSRKIARKLAQTRQFRPIQTTAQLARLVVEAYGPRARSSRMHPATRTFQALRIAVNDELAALQSLLDSITRDAEQTEKRTWLSAGARVAIISFHSLEDRLVKRAFAGLIQRGLAARMTGKPISADEGERNANARSRSAKLRVVRIDGTDAH